jgi:8-oxo-dGTP pyrophosphatase MutT (NUDIX family)
MATSRFQSEQHFSESFVESAGAVIFRLSAKEICTLRLHARSEYVLPKGRRNLGETRQAAALREVLEETGYSCRILPVNMFTRNPPAVEIESLPDKARLHIDACEPFALQSRRLGEDNVKLVWWYIAAINEEESFKADVQEHDKFEVEFHTYADVAQKLTFHMDQEMVKKAIDIVEGTYGNAEISTTESKQKT